MGGPILNVRGLGALGFAACVISFAGNTALGAMIVEPRLGVVATEAVASATDPDPLKLLDSSGTPGIVSDAVDSFFGPSYSMVASTTSGPPIYFPPESALVSVYTSAGGIGSADLARGQLHFPGASDILSLDRQTSDSGVGIRSGFSDIITIIGPIPHPVDVRLALTASGSIKAYAPFYSPSVPPTDSTNDIAVVSLAAQSALSTPSASVGVDDFNGSTVSFTNSKSYGGGATDDNDNASFIRFSVYDDAIVSDKYRTIEFVGQGVANPAADSNGAVEADFGDTADLSITLPPGLSFTSASGILLTEPQIASGGTGTGVPEPSSIALTMTGLAAYLIARRQPARKSRAA